MEKPTDKHVQAIIEIIKGQDIFGSDPFGIYVDDEVYSPLVLIDGKVDLRPIAKYIQKEVDLAYQEGRRAGMVEVDTLLWKMGKEADSKMAKNVVSLIRKRLAQLTSEQEEGNE